MGLHILAMGHLSDNLCATVQICSQSGKIDLSFWLHGKRHTGLFQGSVMERFVARQNIERCRSRLEAETDPAQRTHLLRLLVEEEDKLGLDYEGLTDVEREIVNGYARIARQKTIVQQLDGDGRDSTKAKALLETFELTQQVHAHFRRRILAKINGHDA
jgi:hypothetical protein